MKTTILIYCALACAALGQWSTNIWPSYEHPRQAVPQIQEVHSAAVERCYAAGVSIAGLRLYRSQYDNLTNIKARLKAAVPAYIVTNGMEGDLSGYIESNGIPYYTVTGLLYSVKMPTNFFDYTPWSNLSGVGPLTNSGYAWGNGWTNGWTKAGGTNYPPGRTNWYTTDYGIMWITNVFSALVWANPYLDYVLTARSPYPVSSAPYFTNLFDSVIPQAEYGYDYAPEIFTYTNEYSFFAGKGSFLFIDFVSGGLTNDQAAAIYSSTTRFSPATTSTPPIKCNADFYLKAYPRNALFEFLLTGYDPAFTAETFDNFGDSKVTDQWARVDQRFDTTSTGVVYTVGDTNKPSPWADIPSTVPFMTIRGWSLVEDFTQDKPSFEMILKFDGTNGFKYR